MRTITTIFLDNSLRTILDVIDQTPDLDQAHPGLFDFKEALIKEIQQLKYEARPGISGEDARAV